MGLMVKFESAEKDLYAKVFVLARLFLFCQSFSLPYLGYARSFRHQLYHPMQFHAYDVSQTFYVVSAGQDEFQNQIL